MSDSLIKFQSPVGDILGFYNRSLPASQQASSIPAIFCDSMAVREDIFVNEMKAIPLMHHMDNDDARSCHWVLYSLRPNSSHESAAANPIGTIRLVPFPHHPHPTPRARYEPFTEKVQVEGSETFFSGPPPEYIADIATTVRDGRETFVKLGRLCIVRDFRGERLADQLVQTALKWAGEHPISVDKVPQWKGLVCIHAHEKAVSMWQRNGFVIDEGMGNWYEAGIRHYGMFTRVKVANQAQ